MALRVEDIDLAADRELVERWQAGEHAVFDDLYRRYYARLTSYCRKRVGDRDTAEEIAQEAFVKALQALPKFAGERRFYPWVTVIASRLCVDHHRRLGRVKPVEEIDPGSVDGDHGVRLAFLADVDNLDRALQRLGPRHLEVLELREKRGMTYAEIADHLAVPQSTVEALLFRARKALRREFMAVSGEGRLASIPVFGWILRRLTSAKTRTLDYMPSISQLSGGLAAGAVAAVVSAGSFAGGAAAAAAPIRPGSVATVHIATTSTPSIAQLPGDTSTQAAPAPMRHRRLAAAANAAPGVSTMSSGDARGNASSMPVLADLGNLGAGLDPAAPIGWVPRISQEDR